MEKASTVRPVYIVAGKRTPIGSLVGKLSKFTGPELGSIAIRGALDSIKLNPQLIDEVIMGNVCSAGVGQNPCRQASLGAGIPIKVPCSNVNKVCASGMKAIMLGAQSIALGQSDIVVAGGFESMSNIPYYVTGHRQGNLFGSQVLQDGLQIDGLQDAYNKKPMGFCAEKTASDLHITREENDTYCMQSYDRTLEAIQKGCFKDEIVPVKLQDGSIVDYDEEPRRYKPKKIKTLKPVFQKNGTITAANASKINDGGCALILMSLEKMQELNIKPLAKIVSYADGEAEPVDFCIAPIKSSEKALQRAGLNLPDIDYFEVNEAFSTTVLANMKLLNIDNSKINVNGGAVALGHPIGMSGARIILSMISVLKQRKGKYGISGICNGGGGASSVIIENL